MNNAMPRIGLLGIMQELYDEMIPGITEHQAAYAKSVASRLGDRAEIVFTRPARNRDDVESISRELVAAGVEGVMIVMLTYGPAMRTVRALMELPVPVLLANIQPARSVTTDWTMDDLTYNQGIHGAQDQANALLRAGVPYTVITGDWRSDEFAASFEDWARAAHAITLLRRTRIALLGYPMNGMGDIRYEPPALLRRLGPMIVSEDLGGLVRRIEAVPRRGGRRADRSAPGAVRSRRGSASRAPRDTQRGSRLAIREMLEQHDYKGFSFHFDSIGGDGRFRQLPLLAASDLMADGYGDAAEGDTSTVSLMCAAQAMIGDAHFSRDLRDGLGAYSVLISHMGEGNWKSHAAIGR